MGPHLRCVCPGSQIAMWCSQYGQCALARWSLAAPGGRKKQGHRFEFALFRATPTALRLHRLAIVAFCGSADVQGGPGGGEATCSGFSTAICSARAKCCRRLSTAAWCEYCRQPTDYRTQCSVAGRSSTLLARSLCTQLCGDRKCVDVNSHLCSTSRHSDCRAQASWRDQR